MTITPEQLAEWKRIADSKTSWGNAEFIAMSREAVPALIAEVERLKKYADMLEGKVGAP